VHSVINSHEGTEKVKTNVTNDEEQMKHVNRCTKLTINIFIMRLQLHQFRLSVCLSVCRCIYLSIPVVPTWSIGHP
jgi:hypothetical protein